MDERLVSVKLDSDVYAVTRLIRSIPGRVASGDVIQIQLERGKWYRARVERWIGSVIVANLLND